MIVAHRPVLTSKRRGIAGARTRPSPALARRVGRFGRSAAPSGTPQDRDSNACNGSVVQSEERYRARFLTRAAALMEVRRQPEPTPRTEGASDGVRHRAQVVDEDSSLRAPTLASRRPYARDRSPSLDTTSAADAALRSSATNQSMTPRKRSSLPLSREGVEPDRRPLGDGILAKRDPIDRVEPEPQPLAFRAIAEHRPAEHVLEGEIDGAVAPEPERAGNGDRAHLKLRHHRARARVGVEVDPVRVAPDPRSQRTGDRDHLRIRPSLKLGQQRGFGPFPLRAAWDGSTTLCSAEHPASGRARSARAFSSPGLRTA